MDARLHGHDVNNERPPVMSVIAGLTVLMGVQKFEALPRSLGEILIAHHRLMRNHRPSHMLLHDL